MRCFIAIELDEEIKEQLKLAQGLFEGLDGKFTWARPGQMHLTVKFLGETREDQLDQIKDALKRCAAQVPPFELTIEKLGCFPPTGRKLRVVWAGIDHCDELMKLNELCEQEFEELGFAREERQYSPHLTLARIKFAKDSNAWRRIIARNRDFTAGTQKVNNLILYKSDLSPKGPVYTSLEEVHLGG